MELVNTTPLPARLTVAAVEGLPYRRGLLIAKATARFGEGRWEDLETADPVPLLDRDTPTDGGLLPRDDFPRADPPFEVIMLGAAYASRGRPTEQRRVSLSVGNERRSLAVFGDRVWEITRSGPRISRPTPFLRMPLTYDRAFGGSRDLYLDPDSPVTVSHSDNPLGRGFNPEPYARALAAGLKLPPGAPTFDSQRQLPNIEDPQALIQNWDDAPRPMYWATVPLESGLHARRCIAGTPGPEIPDRPDVSPAVFHRAHPDWVIARPPERATVLLEGLTPEGVAAFRLLGLRVLADWVIGTQTGCAELVPQMLVILPEQRRYTLTYKHVFNIYFEPEVERSVRLRTEAGWMG